MTPNANDLGTTEWLVSELVRARLLERGQLDPILSEFQEQQPYGDANALADHLVSLGLLTPFQVNKTLEGEGRKLVLGPYLLVDTLGNGSMGTVYLGMGRADRQHYAVKVLPLRSLWNVRLARRQVRAFAELPPHAGVVPFLDVGTAIGVHYLVWPFIDGRVLEKVVQDRGPLPAVDIARIGIQIAEALQNCHPRGLFHGLIKPSNVMLCTDQQVRLLDFGIGALLAENMDEEESLIDTISTANATAGILDCASPESIVDPTKRTPTGDQYSLGCTLYYAATGRYPFPDGNAVEKMMAHQQMVPTPVASLRDDLPNALTNAIERLMQKRPEARYTSLDELIDHLMPVTRGSMSNGRLKGVPTGSSANGGLFKTPGSGDSSDSGAKTPSSTVTQPTAPVIPPALVNKGWNALKSSQIAGSNSSASNSGSGAVDFVSASGQGSRPLFEDRSTQTPAPMDQQTPASIPAPVAKQRPAPIAPMAAPPAAPVAKVAPVPTVKAPIAPPEVKSPPAPTPAVPPVVIPSVLLKQYDSDDFDSLKLPPQFGASPTPTKPMPAGPRSGAPVTPTQVNLPDMPELPDRMPVMSLMSPPASAPAAESAAPREQKASFGANIRTPNKRLTIQLPPVQRPSVVDVLSRKLMFWLPKSDLVQCSIFGFAKIAAGETQAIQVFTHHPDATDSVLSLAQTFHPSTAVIGAGYLRREVARGSRMQLYLDMQGAPIDAALQDVNWTGQPVLSHFAVSLPTSMDRDDFQGLLSFGQDNVLIGQVTLQFEVE